MDERAGGLIAWQFSLYPTGHRDRRNLLVHALTNPLFLVGTVAVVSSPFAGLRALVGGLVGVVVAVAAQGRGHKLEASPPVPFRGPGDVAARLFVEQWVTFPRYLVGGGFAAAWRAAR